MSDFTGEGRAEYPHIFFDEMQLGDYAEFPLTRLNELDEQYAGFIADETSFPPHVERARRVRAHIVFELMWRAREEMGDL